MTALSNTVGNYVKKRVRFALMISVLGISSLSCASSVKLTEAKWTRLEWNIDLDKAVFYVEYCEDYAWYNKDKCKKDKWKRFELDYSDPAMRSKLKDKNFKLKFVPPTL